MVHKLIYQKNPIDPMSADWWNHPVQPEPPALYCCHATEGAEARNARGAGLGFMTWWMDGINGHVTGTDLLEVYLLF